MESQPKKFASRNFRRYAEALPNASRNVSGVFAVRKRTAWHSVCSAHWTNRMIRIMPTTRKVSQPVVLSRRSHEFVVRELFKPPDCEQSAQHGFASYEPDTPPNLDQISVSFTEPRHNDGSRVGD